MFRGASEPIKRKSETFVGRRCRRAVHLAGVSEASFIDRGGVIVNRGGPSVEGILATRNGIA